MARNSVNYWSGMVTNYVSWRQNTYNLKPWLRNAELTARYSTVIPKCCIDVFELFTDLLVFNRSKKQPTISSTTPLPIDHPADTELELRTKLDNAWKERKVAVVENALESNSRYKNWNNSKIIIQFCIDHRIGTDLSKLKPVAESFTDNGHLEGIKLLRAWYSAVNSEKYAQAGELIPYLAKCYWVAGNVKECTSLLLHCAQKYPFLNGTTKIMMKGIITETIFSRGEAELRTIVDFVKQFTRESQDYYLVSILWHYLFLSEWFTDQSLAFSLVNEIKELQLCINLMSSSLTSYLIRNNRISDMYRLLEVLLKYKMMDSYGRVNQIMFDHFCRCGDIRRCSEIVKSSVRLKTPLREEQYNQFISWSASGDRFQFTPKMEIKKIYSKF